MIGTPTPADVIGTPTPADVIGTPTAAVRGDDPVVFLRAQGSVAVKGPPRRRATASSWAAPGP
ncbi:hypothetical protein [Streptomyces europaeiscabiei]|uniref:hypothetical protein n=1 Tax=Streptomyces europaeiscabiei TaxID=146819 RepID=UPI0029BD1C84|nr:hypothetical protein [Streptomyces europaeiscabiei]MDX2527966.1 hypothetical protein [Streptomyces europaeiscabiei]